MKEVIIKRANGELTATLSCEIDHHTAKAVREEIDRELSAAMPSKLILDFGAVSFMDSSGIGLILGRARRTEPAGTVIEIVGLSPALVRLVRMSGIEKIRSIKIKA